MRLRSRSTRLSALAAAALLAVMILPSPAQLQTTTVSVPLQWTAPTTGSPVVTYEVQLSTDGGANWVPGGTSTTTSKVLQLTGGLTYTARVRGIDAQSRVGPWSENADPYEVDLGAPGGCGKPFWVR